jgi:hypothetical protein
MSSFAYAVPDEYFFTDKQQNSMEWLKASPINNSFNPLYFKKQGFYSVFYWYNLRVD